MNANRRVARNLIYVFTSEGVGGVLSFVILLLSARLLGVTEFGVFSFILAITGVCQLVADFGLTNLIVREVAQDRQKASYIMSNVLTLAWGLSLIMFLVIAGSGGLMLDSQTQWTALLIMAVAVLATYHSVVYSSVCRAYEQMGYNAFCFVLHKVVLLALVVWFGSKASPFRSTLIGICSAYLLANLLQYLFFFIVVNARFVRFRFGTDWHYALSLFKAAMPIGASMVVRRLTLHVDILMLSALLGAASAGIFNAAYKVVQMVDMIPFAICLPLFPALSRLAVCEPQKLPDFFSMCVKGFLLVALPVTGYLFITADSLIALFYDAEFSAAGGLLKILAFAVTGLFINMLLSYLFVALNHQRFYLLAAFGCLLVNAAADSLLIPLLGIPGAAWGTLCGELCYLMIALVFLRRCKIQVAWWSLAWRPAVVSLLCCALAMFWAPQSLWQIIVFTVFFFLTYLAGLVVFRVFSLSEIQAAMRGMRRVEKMSRQTGENSA